MTLRNASGRRAWWRVRIGQTTLFPRRCACCDGPATDGLAAYHSSSYGWPRVVQTTTSINVPFCKFCATHNLAPEKFTRWGAGAVLGIPFALAVFGNSKGFLERGGAVLAIVVLVAMLVYYDRVARRRRSDCTCPPARFLGHPIAAVLDGGSWLVLTNESYARELADANDTLVEGVSEGEEDKKYEKWALIFLGVSIALLVVLVPFAMWDEARTAKAIASEAQESGVDASQLVGSSVKSKSNGSVTATGRNAYTLERKSNDLDIGDAGAYAPKGILTWDRQEPLTLHWDGPSTAFLASEPKLSVEGLPQDRIVTLEGRVYPLPDRVNMAAVLPHPLLRLRFDSPETRPHLVRLTISDVDLAIAVPSVHGFSYRHVTLEPMTLSLYVR